MRVSVAILLVALFLVEPLSAQRLPRTRSRLSTAEAEAAALAKAEALKRLLAKSEVKTSTESSMNATAPTPMSEASPPSPSPSPSPPSSSPKPSATISSKDANNVTSSRTSPTTAKPSTSTSSVAPPISSVQVRMAFSAVKKLQEERLAMKSAIKDEESNDDAKSKKPADAQESTKEPAKMPSSTSTSTTTSTTTAKPLTSKSPSTKKNDQDDELRDVLRKIHQEVLKQPRNLDLKNKSSDSKSSSPTSTTTSTTKRPLKESESGGLDTAETTYVRQSVHHTVKETEASPLDAQASIQSAKFVLKDQGLQQLPSFVRSKDRQRPSLPNTVRHILIQKQPVVPQQHQQSFQHRQRSQQLTDPIDEEAGPTTTSTTPYPIIPIIHFDKEQSADGTYKTSYETANNIFAEETGFLKNPGVEDQEALVQQGSYSYTAPDGSVISVTYTADEMGFRAAGAHLPTPPPVPPEIQRSLDIIYAQIQRDEEEAAREEELERQAEASETHEESLSPPTTGSKRESRRYLP